MQAVNWLNAEGGTAIGRGLRHCTNMQSLNLNSTHPLQRALGCDMVSPVVRRVPGATDNGVGPDAAQAIAASIAQCSKLHTLYISHNTLGLPGAAALGDALPHCHALTTLDLSGDFQQPDQVAAVCDGLARCTRLAWLDMSSAWGAMQCLAAVLPATAR